MNWACAVPVFARLTAVEVHLSSEVSQNVMQAQLSRGVVMEKVPLCGYFLLELHFFYFLLWNLASLNKLVAYIYT